MHLTLLVCFLRSEKKNEKLGKGTKRVIRIRLNLETKTFYTFKYELDTKKYKINY